MAYWDEDSDDGWMMGSEDEDQDEDDLDPPRVDRASVQTPGNPSGQQATHQLPSGPRPCTYNPNFNPMGSGYPASQASSATSLLPSAAKSVKNVCTMDEEAIDLEFGSIPSGDNSKLIFKKPIKDPTNDSQELDKALRAESKVGHRFGDSMTHNTMKKKTTDVGASSGDAPLTLDDFVKCNPGVSKQFLANLMRSSSQRQKNRADFEVRILLILILLESCLL